MVQTIKWKLAVSENNSINNDIVELYQKYYNLIILCKLLNNFIQRGKFRPTLTNLVMMNTPRVCMQETKKAFRKLSKDDMLGAVQALCNLKGVGPQMASGESYYSKNCSVR